MADWNRIFPDADHRWIMGLRRSESAADFFADVNPTGAMRQERTHWLAEEPHKYAVLLPEAEPALNETIKLARAWGAFFDDDDSAENDPFARLLGLGRAWEPDFVWMHPTQDGVHHLIGGVVCFPSVWALTDKVSRPMSFVHEPVPELNPSIGRQIELFLRQQEPGVVWRRENWSLSRESWLNQHTSRPRRRLDETVGVDDVWFRLEHQLLLKLPQSGSILFGIRVEVVPFRAVVENELAATRFARLLSTMSPTAAGYKDILTVRPILLKMLTSSSRLSNGDR